jgi:hypothetical protein
MAFHLGSLGFLTPFEFHNFEEQVTNVLEGTFYNFEAYIKKNASEFPTWIYFFKGTCRIYVIILEIRDLFR